ncbi:TPA: UDP-glucose/GDP-mannose dehydrogenase family protein [Candidatus Spyradomonas excrementavium]|nr:UDP-glucose/GDP-mannose dehydrogenase family protein [Candidatus Spyradomonas excrementavium]
MKLCVIGTGYVGLVAGTCFASMGNDVICVDKDTEKLKKLEKGIIPIFEPGLDSLILENVRENRLKFTDDLDFAVKHSKVCFIAVGTPQKEDGSADLSAVFEVAEQIAASMNEYKVIVNKSTVPVGTCEKIAEIIKNKTGCAFDVVSNPEFLKQGAAVEDFLKPDRVIIGAETEESAKIMNEIYSPFLRTGNPVITMDIKSAEMTKYAANAFLAVKISYANEIANICENIGANAEMVRKGMCADKRIGSLFLFPGLGYGGSCFPKDVKALMSLSKEKGYTCEMLIACDNINLRQRYIFINKIFKKLGRDLSGMTFALWGLAFKPNTNDMREAPAITIINELTKAGAKIQAFDPKAVDSAKSIFGDSIKYSESAYEALEGADALILATEWNEFRNPDFELIKNKLKSPLIFDGRNQYNVETMKKYGFDYICVGRKPE